jgi:hypothetical protein
MRVRSHPLTGTQWRAATIASRRSTASATGATTRSAFLYALAQHDCEFVVMLTEKNFTTCRNAAGVPLRNNLARRDTPQRALLRAACDRSGSKGGGAC